MQSTTRVKPFICTMPMRLDDGWNQIQFNLSDFTRRAYGMFLQTYLHRTAPLRAITVMKIRWSMYLLGSTGAGTNYIETLRVQIHANCRIRRIYFSDKLYTEEELPPEFKLFLPVQKTD